MVQSGSDKAAIAWVIAKNIEQNSSIEKQKKAYREGIVDTEKDVPFIDTQEELLPTPIPPNGSIEISVDPDGKTDGDPFVGNLENGIFFDCGENTYKGMVDNYTVKIFVDYSIIRTVTSIPKFNKGALKWELYGSSGLVAYDYSMSTGNWFVKDYVDEGGIELYRYVDKWTISPFNMSVYAEHRYCTITGVINMNWSKSSSAISDISTGELNNIKTIWKNAKTISTIPTT